MQSKYESDDWEDSLDPEQLGRYQAFRTEFDALWAKHHDVLIQKKAYDLLERRFYDKRQEYLANKAYYQLWLRQPGDDLSSVNLYSDALHRWILSEALKQPDAKDPRVEIRLVQTKNGWFCLDFWVWNLRSHMQTCWNYQKVKGNKATPVLYLRGYNKPLPDLTKLTQRLTNLEKYFLDPGAVLDSAFCKHCLGLAFDYSFETLVVSDFSPFWEVPGGSLIKGLNLINSD